MDEWNEGIIAALRDERDELREHIAELYVERDQARVALAEALEVVRDMRCFHLACTKERARAEAFLAKYGGTKLDKLLKQSAAAYDAMSPEEKAAHDEAQRQSWIRSMAPCEHGVRDWEGCPDCIAKHGGTDDNTT